MAGDLVAEAALLSTMAVRFAAKAGELAEQLASREAAAEGPDLLEPIRDAMRQYEAAIEAGQHPRIASAQFIDAVYAVMKPAAPDQPVPVVVKTDDPEPLTWDADTADSEGWGG